MYTNFVYLIRIFHYTPFFTGCKRKNKINSPFAQVFFVNTAFPPKINGFQRIFTFGIPIDLPKTRTPLVFSLPAQGAGERTVFFAFDLRTESRKKQHHFGFWESLRMKLSESGNNERVTARQFQSGRRGRHAVQ